MHPPETRAEAARLTAEGLNDRQVSLALGVSRFSVRGWRDGEPDRNSCPRCWKRSLHPIVFEPADYAELLGLYLGDGHIVQTERTFRLRVFLDAKYRHIVREARGLLQRTFAGNSVGLTFLDRGSTAVVWVYSSHAACLIPQFGPGKKHERNILLEDWQWRAVEQHPWRFIRGCIHSDGCAFINRTGPYRYLSYEFTNLSSQIRRTSSPRATSWESATRPATNAPFASTDGTASRCS